MAYKSTRPAKCRWYCLRVEPISHLVLLGVEQYCSRRRLEIMSSDAYSLLCIQRFVTIDYCWFAHSSDPKKEKVAVRKVLLFETRLHAYLDGLASSIRLWRSPWFVPKATRILRPTLCHHLGRFLNLLDENGFRDPECVKSKINSVCAYLIKFKKKV